ncbi:MAG: CoA transferase [Chloroflexi bacterium]|nr:CoA transferase [Chloroflexota bacterium]
MNQVFEGIRVADFSWHAAGPMIVKFLGDHGATVVHVESTTRLDGLRTTPPFRDNKPGINRAASFADYNNNKYGLTLNLKHPEGRELARKLVAWADVVAESFLPGTMKRFGLSYEDIKPVNPGVVMISSCNQGQTGPNAVKPGFGTQLTAQAGFVNLTGWPDRPPVLPWGAYTDFTSGKLGAAILVAALDYRRRTGKGQYIDLSQYEASLHYVAPLLLDYSINGTIASRRGNKCASAAPHDAYPCVGDDRWCAIAVFTDDEWLALCQAMQKPELAGDPRFATVLERKKNEAELDEIVAAWTRRFPAHEVMATLQKVGVPAGVVQDTGDIMNDPQVKHMHRFWELDHPEMGRHHYDTPSFRLSKTPYELNMPAPLLGQHNEHVCTRFLGIGDAEFVRMMEDGVFD